MSVAIGVAKATHLMLHFNPALSFSKKHNDALREQHLIDSIKDNFICCKFNCSEEKCKERQEMHV